MIVINDQMVARFSKRRLAIRCNSTVMYCNGLYTLCDYGLSQMKGDHRRRSIFGVGSNVSF